MRRIRDEVRRGGAATPGESTMALKAAALVLDSAARAEFCAKLVSLVAASELGGGRAPPSSSSSSELSQLRLLLLLSELSGESSLPSSESLASD